MLRCCWLKIQKLWVFLVKLRVILTDILFKALSFNMEQRSNDIEGRNHQVAEKPVPLPILLYVMQSPGLETGCSLAVPTVPNPRTAIPCLLTPSKAIDWQFPTNANVKQAATSWFQMLDTDFFLRRLTSLSAMMDECLNDNDDFMKSGVYHLLATCHVYIRVGEKFPIGEYLWLVLQLLCIIKTKNTLSQIWLQNKFCHNMYNHGRINNYECIKSKKVNL